MPAVRGGVILRCMAEPPVGTVTLLFTDIDGSTRLLERLGTERYAVVLDLHRRVLREAFARHGGYEVGTEGDAFFVAFWRARDAVEAAAAGQRALAAAEWPDDAQLRVRMGVHTGDPLLVGPNYVGMDVHRAARIMSAGHGGQVLVSEATAALLGHAPLRDLGPHRLKDLLEPIRLYQLEIDAAPDAFPPLRSLHRTNLPRAAWPLLGRDGELKQIRTLVSEGVRLLTLTGPGGSGKTRLALQAAAELSDEFPDGVFFVALAPLRDAAAVQATVAESIGLQPGEDVAAWLRSRRVLLVLDNLEHLPGAEAVVGDLVAETVIFATSRAPVRLAAERELPVDPLPEQAAVELFVTRAAASGRDVSADETVAAVCRRLDNLPLALELAAARAKLLPPSALLQRLDLALPLLTGGPRDLPERQRTLRATIEWSHDLLDGAAQAAFRRLSVFRGSFRLDAAEAITGAGLDQLAALLDQSLLKPLGDDRFFMLETLREYARGCLDVAGETDDYALLHAQHYLAQLEGDPSALRSPSREQLGWFAAEEDNLRAMLDRLINVQPSEAARACHLLWTYWYVRGAFPEARQRLQEVLADAQLSSESQSMLLEHLAGAEESLENLDAAEEAGRRAVAAAQAAGRKDLLVQALRESAWIIARRGRSDDALRLIRRAADMAASIDDQTRLSTIHDLGALLGEARQSDEAREVFQQAIELGRSLGDTFVGISVLIQVGFIDLHERRFEEARQRFSSALDQNRQIGHYGADSLGRWGLGYALLGLGQRHQASSTFAQALDVVLGAPQPAQGHLGVIASGIAHTAEREDAGAAARLRGAIGTLRARRGWHEDPRNLEIELVFDQRLIEALGQEAWDQERAAGAAMSLEETIAVARSLAGVGASQEPDGPLPAKEVAADPAAPL